MAANARKRFMSCTIVREYFADDADVVIWLCNTAGELPCSAMGTAVTLSLLPPRAMTGSLHYPGKKKGPIRIRTGPYKIKFGGDLLSHTVTHAVPSALRGLTSVFGMGTGVTLSLLPPKNSKFGYIKQSNIRNWTLELTALVSEPAVCLVGPKLNCTTVDEKR
jgi:hypothetical protein